MGVGGKYSAIILFFAECDNTVAARMRTRQEKDLESKVRKWCINV